MTSKPPVWSRINREHALTRGLALYLPFNEGAGAYAHDPANGAYNRADLTNGPLWVPGMDGPALSFDGTNDYVKTTRADVSFVVSAATPLTYIAWINPLLTGTGKQGIVSVGEFNDNNWSSTMGIEPTTGELWWLADTGGTGSGSGLITVANKWQFIAVVRTASAVGFFLGSYGGPLSRATASDSNSGAIGSDPIVIGAAGHNSAAGAFFPGKIGSAMVYNRALSDSEVQQLFADPYALFQKEEEVGFVAAAGGTITGTLSVTLADATLSATGTVLVSGSESSTLGAATGSASGAVTVTGTESQTLGAATSSATGAVTVTGTESSTGGAATSSSGGTVLVTGTLSATLAAATLSATGTTTGAITGTLTATLANATVSATGTVAGSITGTLTVTLGAAALAATAAVRGILHDEIRDALKEVEGSIEDIGPEISGALVELEGLL